MMIQASDQQLLWDYLDNQLDAKARLALETRLAKEPALAEQLQRYRSVHQLLSDDKLAASLPENFEAAVLAKIPLKQQKNPLTASSGRLLNILMIATGGLTGLAYWLQQNNLPGLNTNNLPLPESQTLLMSMLCLNGFLILLLIDRYLQHRRWLHGA